MARRVKVCLTMGDPSGVGPAITGRALRECLGTADFTVIGSARVLSLLPKGYGLPEGVRLLDVDNVPVRGFSFGKLSPVYGRACMEYLDAACAGLSGGEYDCLVTCPISKEAINAAGFRWPGHTEYLAWKAGAGNPEMILLNDKLRFVTLTRHLPLRDAARAIKPGRLSVAVTAAHNCLKNMLRIRVPRLAVCGINPHAGDNGVIGDEERRLLSPEVERLRLKFGSIDGPLSADVAIARAFSGGYDCVVAMYHDQAMIPLKLTGGGSGVNLTAGLPYVRTSPLHGTAFDIAGKPKSADPASLISALRLAIKCTLNLKRD
ncbi:MAG: 4-hydroxythreonine-4-phosphate dehydrogenase PdxA [Candidatus Omnitrophota bacterium]